MAESPGDLVGKEFIFEYGVDRILPPSEKTGGIFATEQRTYRRERIVRCRDCERALDGATCGIWCMDHHRQVEPDGFCAWGDRRGE